VIKMARKGRRVSTDTLQGTNISPKHGILKMIFLFPRWDMLVSQRVDLFATQKHTQTDWLPADDWLQDNF